MITAASNLYGAYQVCDDSITASESEDLESDVCKTSYHFHKVFMKCGGYSLEFDTNADHHYDASGLGRVHHAKAPSSICISVPCPSCEDGYKLNLDTLDPIAIAPGCFINDGWKFATTVDVKYELSELSADRDFAKCSFKCDFSEGNSLKSEFKATKAGVEIKICGNGGVACMLPAFTFDGENYTKINLYKNTLSVAYGGWVCKYTADGEITETGMNGGNRNGHYRAYMATAKDSLNIKIEIQPESI